MRSQKRKNKNWGENTKKGYCWESDLNLKSRKVFFNTLWLIEVLLKWRKKNFNKITLKKSFDFQTNRDWKKCFWLQSQRRKIFFVEFENSCFLVSENNLLDNRNYWYNMELDLVDPLSLFPYLLNSTTYWSVFVFSFESFVLK